MTNKIHAWLVPTYQATMSSFAQASLPHALLFYGERGNGASALLAALSQTILCKQPSAKPIQACGHCPSCLLFFHGTHPDVITLAPEDNVPIGVDVVRSLFTFCAQTSTMGQAKVICLPQAHALNPAASNALLKILEEPTPDTYFLLATHKIQIMAPTVLSRCRKNHVLNPSTETLQAMFPNINAKVGGLDLEDLSWLAQDEKRLTAMLRFRECLNQVIKGKEVATALSQGVDESNLPIFFRDVLTLIQTFIHQGLGIFSVSEQKVSKQKASTLAALMDFYQEGLQLWQLLQYNNAINKTLMIDGFMIRLRAFYKESYVSNH